MASNYSDLIRTTTYRIDGDRAIRLAVNLHCPRCGTELTADDVLADSLFAYYEDEDGNIRIWRVK